MSRDRGRRRRKRRTRAHVLEDLSENYLEHKVLLCGHILRRPERDYGVDVTMFHFDRQGRLENGEVRFQLKASDSWQTVQGGSSIACRVKIGDLNYWQHEFYPFILVVFDAKNSRGYWLHVQEYMAENATSKDIDQDTVSLRVPLANELTVDAIEGFRQRSLGIVQRLAKHGEGSHATRKPK